MKLEIRVVENRRGSNNTVRQGLVPRTSSIVLPRASLLCSAAQTHFRFLPRVTFKGVFIKLYFIESAEQNVF